MRNVKLFKLLLLILCLSCLLGACAQEGSEEKRIVLNERQQKLADSIWANRHLWEGCEQLTLYRVGRGSGYEYYLSANFLVSQSNAGNLFGGGDAMVGTYKRHTFRVVDGRVVDNLTLGEDGILAAAQQLGGVSLAGANTDEELKLRIKRVASKY